MKKKVAEQEDDLAARPAHSFNSNIRLYKYTEGQHFGCHYDDWCRDEDTGAHSEWTLLIYLSGEEDGVVGGEVSSSVYHLINLWKLCSEKYLIFFADFLFYRLYSTRGRESGNRS